MSGKYNSFYNKLAKVGINMPTREEFNAYMDTDEGRRGLHSRLIRDGYLDDNISYEQWGKNLPRLNTNDTSKSYGVMASDAYTNRYTRQAEEQRIDQETKAEEAKRKQTADAYNAMSKLEDTFAAYEQSQDVAELFPGAKSESSTEWRDRVAQRKEGEAQAKAKVDQEREELRQRMQLLKDNPDAWEESLEQPLQTNAPEVGLRSMESFANGKPVDKRGNVQTNWVGQSWSNQAIDAENKARQLGMQSQELQDMLADPMALDNEMTRLKAELAELTKQRDAYGSQFAKEHPWQMMANLMGRDSFDNPYEVGVYGVDAMETQKQMNNVIARINMLTEAKNAFERGSWSGHGFWNNVKNIGKGMQQFATEINSYTDKYNIESGMALNNLANKIERGEMLTDEEMSWFVAVKLKEEGEKAASQGPTTGAVGYGAPASIEYMVTMALNPARGASKTISDKIIETGVRRFGKSAFTKMMAKATGMLAEGAVLSTTLGADNVASDALGRMAGKVGFDDSGNVAVADRVNPLKAMYQSTMASTIESAVEMMGVPIIGKATKGIGKVATKLADAMSYGKVSKLLSAMDKSQIVNWTKGMQKATGWHNLGEEWGEENVTMLTNAIIVGDNEIADMFDTRTQLEILGTCALISGAMSTANIAGFAAEYHKVNREFKKAKQEVLRQFSSDVWASLDNLITNAQDEDLTVRLADAMDGMAMNQEQRSAIMNYLTALKRYQKFNELNDGGKFVIGGPQQAQATQSTSTYEIDSDITLKDEIGNPIDAHIVGRDANGNYMVESSQPINGKRVQPMSADQLDAMVIPNTPDGIQQSEVDGYNLTDANQQAEVSMLADNAKEEVATLLGVTPDEVDATLQQVLGDTPTDAKIEARFGNSADVVKDYVHGVAKVKGMTTRVMDDIADAIAESDKAIDAVSNNGNVVTAMLGKEKVNITSGEVVTFDDGVVDKANSSKSVTIKYADGSTEMVSPTTLTEVVVTPVEQAKQQQAQAITQQKQQAFADVMGGALDYTQGKQYTMLNEDGSTTDVTIVADNGDGNVTVTARDGNKQGGVTDGKEMVLPKSQIQQGVREFKRNQLRAESAQQTSIPQAESTPTEVAQPQQVDTTPRDEQGNILYEEMDADSAWDALLAETDGDAEMALAVANEMIADKTKAVEEASKMVAQPGVTPQEKIANLKAVKQAQAKAQADLAKWQEIANTSQRRASMPTEVIAPTEETTPTEEVVAPITQETKEKVEEKVEEFGLVMDKRAKSLNDDFVKVVDTLAKKLGLVVEFVDEIVAGKDAKTGKDIYANANVVGNRVQISWNNRDRAIQFLLGHEFLHRMRDISPEAYNNYVNSVKTAIGEQRWNELVKTYTDSYKRVNANVTEEQVIEEIVADYAGKLVQEKGVFDKWVSRNADKTLWQNVRDVLVGIRDFLANIGWTKDKRNLNKAIDALNNLIESATTSADVVEQNEDRFSIPVYHGSGAEFSEFDHAHMSEGEGNQAFGWGTYVTEVKGIAKMYAGASGATMLTYKGNELDTDGLLNPWRVIKDLYNENKGRLREMRNRAEHILNLVEEDNTEMKQLWQSVVDTLKQVRAGDLKVKPKRYLYSVEIPDDTGKNYLNYYEEMPKKEINKVRNKLESILAQGDYKGVEKELKEELDSVFVDGLTASDVYGNVSAYLGGDKEASKFFSEMGYVGIKYPTNSMSGNKQAKDSNYVIFKESDAKIVGNERFSLSNLSTEEQSIVDEAKANGTYLKAPNGKVSNLNERQWVQVRTKAFKDWFGDWELANLYNRALIAWNDKNSKGKVVVDLSEKAKARFKELLGKDISQFVITDDSIRHIKNNHGAREEFRGQKDMTPDDIVIIPYLVNNFDSMELNPRYDDKLGNRAIEITKRINGVSVVATIERGNNKEFLVTNYELVRSDALDASNETPGPNVRNDSDIAKVQKDIEDIKQKANNSSKIVDENGEPMVVYHGSYWNPLEEAEGKAVFKDSFRGTSSGDNGFFGRGHYFAFGHGNLSKAEARYYGSNVFDAFLNIRNPFMYVETIYKDYNPENGKSDHNASLIAINTAKAFPNLVEDFQVEQFDGNGDKVDSISIKDYAGIFDKVYKEKEFIVEKSDEYPNLIYVKADPVEHTNEDLNISWVEYGWEMRMVAPAEREDKQFIFAHHYLTQEVYGKEGHSFYILPERELNALSESEEFTSTLKERGYDGVLQSAIGDEAVAFEPTQIKSATDNVGTFDNANPDVRYSLQNKYGIKVGENIQIETIRDLFNEWNSNEELSELFDKVYDVASKLTFDIAFNKLENKKALGLYNAGAGLMELSVDLLTDAMKSQRKAQTILHELIHSVTTYAMYIDEYQELRDEFGNLAPNVKKAVDVLNEVYEEIKKDKIFKGEYGITNSKEMVAELANGRFRDKLKEKGLWQKVVEAIKELFGIATDTDTRFDKANNALNDLLDNFDRSLWAQTASMGEKIFFDKGDVAEGEGQQMRYSLRTKPAPKKTIKVYKLFNVDENGNPQALFIDAANALEVGVWLDADSPNVKDLESLETEWLYLLDKDGNVVDKKPLKRGKAGNFVGLPSKAEVNDATQNNQRWMSVSTAKSGERAYHTIGINGAGGVSTYALRPGWHATNAPSARHIGVGKDGANAVYRGANQRWFEIEISADVDYNEEARERYLKAHPTYSREKAYSDLKGDIPERIPEDGYYNFKTNSNANPNQDWYIAGAIKIVRPLTEEEGRKISRSKGIAEDLPYKDGVKNFDDSEGNKQKVDNQGNPIDENGNLIIEEISSIDEITDNDFANPTRNIELPKIPQNVENAIGANGKPVIIKKNIFVKNKIRHPELSPEDGRNIFKRALYNPNLYGSSQPMTRPDYKVVIQTGAYNAIVVLDVYQYKENIEIIGWRLIDEKGLEKMKRQANREGGQFLILSPLEGSAAALSALPSDLSADKDNANSSDVQAKSGKGAKFSLQGTGGVMDNSIAEYEKRVNTKGKGGKLHISKFNAMEAMQDGERALKESQRVVEKQYGIQLEDFEDAYKAENALSSVNQAEWERYIKDYYEPMMEIIDKWILKGGETEQTINHYLIAKSGLERNREFTVRDAFAEMDKMDRQIINGAYSGTVLQLANALRQGQISQDEYDAQVQEAKDKKNQALENIKAVQQNRVDAYRAERDALREQLKNGDITYEEFNQWSDEAAIKHAKVEEIKDYSGLTALAKQYNEKDWRNFAEQMVTNFERKHNNTDVLWERINNATKKAVDKSYESGITSKEAKDHLDQMFLWYVPMGGMENDTAEDIYSYLNRNADSAFTQTVKRAEGHSEHISDDVMAMIANTMQSAILQGNRNNMKQKFLNMVQNYPTELFTLDRGWLVLKGNEWVESHPEIKADYTAEQVRDAINAHNEEMRNLEEQGLAMSKEGALKLGVPFKNAHNEQEHAISVMRNGQKVTIYVNGNPRVAQALNGKLKDVEQTWIGKAYGKLKRYFSASKTSWNPDFVSSNFSRDIGHSTSMTFVRHGVGEWGKSVVMYAPATATLVAKALGKKSPFGAKYDQYFDEFVRNGGITGYSHLYSVDDWKIQNTKRIDRLRGVAKAIKAHNNLWVNLAKVYKEVNSIIENSSRFNEYARSRNRGEGIATSIWNAKEITLNFNKKGSSKTEGLFGGIAFLGRNFVPFFNPIMQGIYQFLKIGKEHKRRMTALCFGYMGMGFMQPFVNAMLVELLGGGDEDDYMKQPEYTRRTNFMLYVGDGYIKIPLAQIFREFYGIGDVIYSAMYGKLSEEDATSQAISQVRKIFSVDGVSTYFDWVADIMTNTNFMGNPLWKENDFNEYKPEYTKAYDNTWAFLVSASKWMNEALGGDEYTAPDDFNGKWINPAIWQRVLSELGGGALTSVLDVYDTASALVHGEDVDWANVPIAKRLYTETDEETLQKWIDKEYFSNLDNYKKVKDRMSSLKSSPLDVAEKIDFMYHSPEYLEYVIFDDAQKEIKELRDLADSATDDNRTEREKALYDAELEVVEAIDAVRAMGDNEVQTFMMQHPEVAYYINKDIERKVKDNVKELQKAIARKEPNARGALSTYRKSPEYKYYNEIRRRLKRINKLESKLNDDTKNTTPSQRLKWQKKIDDEKKELVELRKAYESIGEINK